MIAMEKNQDKPKYYDDGITKVTDPFWEYSCTNGHSGWSLTYMDHCPICESQNVSFTNSEIKKGPSS